MRNPTKKILGKTWVGWLNILLLQWFCIRLGYGNEWKILKWIVPCTGWWSDYRYIGRK